MKSIRRPAQTWRRSTVRLGVLFASSFPLFGLGPKEHKERTVYCVRSGQSDWTYQTNRPLLNLRSRQAVAEIMYDEEWLEKVRVRQLDTSYELVFQYKFSRAGKLTELTGYLKRWGGWSSEIDLTPDPDGSIPARRIEYHVRNDGQRSSEPDDAERYKDKFKAVSIYTSIAEIPCAGLLKETEKKNATQE